MQKYNKNEPCTRILVVGSTHSGKTLLLKRLCHNVFCSDSESHVFFNTAWSPTVGFYVDVLQRDTDGGHSYDETESPPSSTPLNSSLTTRVPSGNRLSSFTQFFKGKSSTGNAFSKGNDKQRQVIEFYEFGGNENLVNGSWLTIHSMRFDGVILLYSRENLDSVQYAFHLYRRLKHTILQSSPSVVLSELDPKEEGVVPPFLLIGTNVQPPLYPTTSSGAADIPDEMLTSANVEQWQRERKKGAHPSSPSSSLFSLLQPLFVVLQLMAQSIINPGYILSLRFRDETDSLLEGKVGVTGKAFVRHCIRVLKAVASVVYFVDSVLSYAMAVVLFGPKQDHVSLNQRGEKDIVNFIARDMQCVGHLSSCDLYSATALDPSVSEFTNFFDLLYRKRKS